MLDFDAVREIARSLADVVDGTAYGAPALKLRGSMFACVPVNKSAELNSIVVRIELSRRAQLLRQHPEIYYITDHYAPHPTVLVRLSKITPAELKQLLHEAWEFSSAKPSRAARSSRRSKPAAKPRGARKGPRRT